MREDRESSLVEAGYGSDEQGVALIERDGAVLKRADDCGEVVLDIQSVAQEEEQLEVCQHVQQSPPLLACSGQLLLQISLCRVRDPIPVTKDRGGAVRTEKKRREGVKTC
jgi:hypothetical protein